jgi:glycosyltransferase involved in cell wall biosynthesis
MEKIAVLIPCYNEEKTIARVVEEFKRELPDADVYVFDNNSVDGSVQEARKAGAIIRKESRQGKGNVVRSMFRTVEADIYVMVDGDGTYPSGRVSDLIKPIREGEADMTIGSRLHPGSDSQFRVLNRAGNRMFMFILNSIFRIPITDLLSGYRAFSRRLVKTLPILSRGFEIETELTVKCFERRYRIVEIPVNLVPRPKGSESKINVFRDGLLILNTIFSLFRDYKPFTVFGSLGLLLVGCGFVPGAIVISEFLKTGLVLRVPLAILSIGCVLSGLLSLFTGLILHSMANHQKEQDYLLENILYQEIRSDVDSNRPRD